MVHLVLLALALVIPSWYRAAHRPPPVLHVPLIVVQGSFPTTHPREWGGLAYDPVEFEKMLRRTHQGMAPSGIPP